MIWIQVMMCHPKRVSRNDPVFGQICLGKQWRSRSGSLIRVYTVCHSVCIVWTHYSMVVPHSSNFRVIATNFLGVRIFRKLRYLVLLKRKAKFENTFICESCFSKEHVTARSLLKCNTKVQTKNIPVSHTKGKGPKIYNNPTEFENVPETRFEYKVPLKNLLDGVNNAA